MKKIRFGLTAIKGFGEEPASVILAEREAHGPFDSLTDFATRIPAKFMNKKTLEALAFSGALDCFGDRGDIVASINDLSKFAKENEEKNAAGQIDLFGMLDDETGGDIGFKLRDQKATKEDILKWERESLGMFVSDHPLRGLEGYFEKYGSPIGQLILDYQHKLDEEAVLSAQLEQEALEQEREDMLAEELEEKPKKKSKKKKAKVKKEKKPKKEDKETTMHGLVIAVKRIITKAGKNMAIFDIEDASGKMECVIFPRQYDMIPQDILNNGLVIDSFLKIVGKVQEKDGALNCIIAEIIVGDLKDVQERGGEIKSQKQKKEEAETYTVEIPDGTTKPQVDEIKKLLISAKSATVGSQKVLVKIDNKQVYLPFKITAKPELTEKIAGILGEVSF